MKGPALKKKAFLCILGLLLLLAPLSVRAEYGEFAIVSDTHVGAPGSAYPVFISNIEREGISMIVHTGDAIDSPGSLSQWAQFFDITGSGKRLFLAPGNHDIRGPKSLEVYLRFFGAPYFSASDGDTLLLFLNTELPVEESRIAGEQLAWLRSETARPFRYKFVFLHEPLFPVIPLHGLDRHEQERDSLHLLFVRSGVSLVVAGHDHVYDRRLKDGIVYVIAGRTGGQAILKSGNGDMSYLTVRRTGDFYSFETKKMDGEAKDRFTVRREASAP
jgi:3',5'-cyclic AMP phosphodiesterase CpdA